MDLPLATQRRVEIARALATNPQILLLDEVMAGLTQSELRQAMQLVSQLRERGITIFMIEHVMPAIMEVCDRIIVLHYGKVVAEGSPGEVANDRTVHEIYLGR
jgi:ABC-type branched-subunit amino acid transport system ATPase component